MSLIVVHREVIYHRYRAHLFSSANFYRLCLYPMTLLLTLIIAFATQGFWLRTNTYIEEPIVEFKGNFLFIFEDSVDGRVYFWSPFDDLNANYSNNLIIPSSVESSGKNLNELKIRIEFSPISDVIPLKFTSVFYALFFDVRLEKRAFIKIPSTPVFERVEIASNYNELNIATLLDFTSMMPLPPYGNFTEKEWDHRAVYSNQNNSSDGMPSREKIEDLLNSLGLDLQQFASHQNLSVEMSRKTELWSWSQTNHLFVLNFHARIREQILHYRTTGWELLKWAWIQFLAIGVVIYTFTNIISSYLFQNQIFTVATEKSE